MASPTTGFAAVGGIPTELGVRRRDQAFKLGQTREKGRVFVSRGHVLVAHGRDLGVLGSQQRHDDDVVCCVPA